MKHHLNDLENLDLSRTVQSYNSDPHLLFSFCYRPARSEVKKCGGSSHLEDIWWQKDKPFFSFKNLEDTGSRSFLQ